MTYLKKIIFAATLAVASLGFSSVSSAALISHNVFFDEGLGAGEELIGEVTVHLFENGATGLQDIEEFVSFSLFGLDATIPPFGFFLAVVNRDDVFAGIEFLAFDLDLVGIPVAVQGVYDAFALDPAVDNFVDVIDITDPNNLGFLFGGQLILGAATVVSEPSVLAIFALALVGFGVRRKAK